MKHSTNSVAVVKKWFSVCDCFSVNLGFIWRSYAYLWQIDLWAHAYRKPVMMTPATVGRYLKQIYSRSLIVVVSLKTWRYWMYDSLEIEELSTMYWRPLYST